MISDQSRSRMCVSCGRTLPWDANVCPYCGHDYRYQGKKKGIDEGTKIVFYILSFLIWIAGVIIGVIYYSKPDEESKHVGRMCLLLAAVSVGLSVGLSFVLWLTFLSWA